MKKQGEIILENTSRGLMAYWLDVNGYPDEGIVELFGTHILPTAYTAGADMPEAVREIRRLNPDRRVSAV